jgi:hypothetical protein
MNQQWCTGHQAGNRQVSGHDANNIQAVCDASWKTCRFQFFHHIGIAHRNAEKLLSNRLQNGAQNSLKNLLIGDGASD